MDTDTEIIHRHALECACVSHAQAAHNWIRLGRLSLAEYHVRMAEDRAARADTVDASIAAGESRAHYDRAIAWLRES
jgi:hypothetical protein